MSLKLYCISQNDNNGYDTYDSAVVCAEDEMQARNMHPNGFGERLQDSGKWGGWTLNPKKVTVRLIGYATHQGKAGVICASYNAG